MNQAKTQSTYEDQSTFFLNKANFYIILRNKQIHI